MILIIGVHLRSSSSTSNTSNSNISSSDDSKGAGEEASRGRVEPAAAAACVQVFRGNHLSNTSIA